MVSHSTVSPPRSLSNTHSVTRTLLHTRSQNTAAAPLSGCCYISLNIDAQCIEEISLMLQKATKTNKKYKKNIFSGHKNLLSHSSIHYELCGPTAHEQTIVCPSLNDTVWSFVLTGLKGAGLFGKRMISCISIKQLVQESGFLKSLSCSPIHCCTVSTL